MAQLANFFTPDNQQAIVLSSQPRNKKQYCAAKAISRAKVLSRMAKCIPPKKAGDNQERQSQLQGNLASKKKISRMAKRLAPKKAGDNQERQSQLQGRSGQERQRQLRGINKRQAVKPKCFHGRAYASLPANTYIDMSTSQRGRLSGRKCFGLEHEFQECPKSIQERSKSTRDSRMLLERSCMLLGGSRIPRSINV